MNKSTRQIARKTPAQPAKTARRAGRTLTPPSADGARFSQITKSLDVVPPEGCFASVIFKQVAHDSRSDYAVWLVVGRYQQDALSMRYKFTGEHTVRCDVPNGVALAFPALEKGLVKFMKGQPTLSDDPPVILIRGH